VYAPSERADTLPLFLLYPYVYSVVTPPPLSPPPPPFLGVQFNKEKQQSFLLTSILLCRDSPSKEEESFPIKKTTFSNMYSFLVLVQYTQYIFVYEYLFYLPNSKTVAKFIVPDWGIWLTPA
jgi:hypothetical protein